MNLLKSKTDLFPERLSHGVGASKHKHRHCIYICLRGNGTSKFCDTVLYFRKNLIFLTALLSDHCKSGKNFVSLNPHNLLLENQAKNGILHHIQHNGFDGNFSVTVFWQYFSQLTGKKCLQLFY